ncbi:MAG: DoxX family protein [Lysobacter sp.]|nr:DoxX family protein [Lysobacter sp.]
MNQNAQNDAARFLLRIALGALILLHGIAKLRGGLAGIQGMVVAHHWPAWLAYGVLLGEVVGPLMVLLGFFSRLGALLIAIDMVFALALVHMGQLGQLTSQGGWALELQAMYFAAAVALALLGPGRYSINGR